MSNSTLGTGWGFPPQFSNNGSDVQLVADEEDVRQALEILFSTAINERLMRPGFGCDLKKFMFEDVNKAIITEVKNIIIDSMYDYEPRINVRSVEIRESGNDATIMLIEINYLILATNSVQNMVYPLKVA